MTLIRGESPSLTAPSEVRSALIPPFDSRTRARDVIAQASGLDEGEREGVARSFEERFGDAKVTEFLPIFAGRVVREVQKSKTSPQNGKATPIEVFPAAVVNNTETAATPRGRFRRLPRIRRR